MIPENKDDFRRRQRNFRSWKTRKSHGKDHGKSWDLKSSKEYEPRVRCNIEVGLTICSFFFSSELAGGTPNTVRCNIKVGLAICIYFVFSSELAGGTPHTVRCNIKLDLTICSFFLFFHLNWWVAHLIQSDVT